MCLQLPETWKKTTQNLAKCLFSRTCPTPTSCLICSWGKHPTRGPACIRLILVHCHFVDGRGWISMASLMRRCCLLLSEWMTFGLFPFRDQVLSFTTVSKAHLRFYCCTYLFLALCDFQLFPFCILFDLHAEWSSRFSYLYFIAWRAEYLINDIKFPVLYDSFLGVY